LYVNNDGGGDCIAYFQVSDKRACNTSRDDETGRVVNDGGLGSTAGTFASDASAHRDGVLAFEESEFVAFVMDCFRWPMLNQWRDLALEGGDDGDLLWQFS
jgi:hypothetical protein